jgi:DNA end-binding protein Ku
MARAIWTGSLSFGLVSVPVGLYSATEDKTVHFNQIQAGTADRVRNRRVNERTGEEVEFRDVVKGFEVAAGEYVVLTPEELEGVEPQKSRTIDVADFVDLEEIDPIYFQRSYYLAPQGEAARRAYALLLRVMSHSKKVGIATFVMRNKEYLVAVRPGGDVLALETMFFADEIRDPRSEIDGIPVEADFTERELETAELLLDSMTASFDPQNYHDTYRERVEELVEHKRKGEEIVAQAVPEEPARVIDLADALQKSVEAAKDRHRAATPNRAGRADRDGRPFVAEKSPKARPTPHGRSGVPGVKRVTSRSPGVEDLSGMSRSDLYQRATELDVPGRSKMNREELEAALRTAGSSRRRRAS